MTLEKVKTSILNIIQNSDNTIPHNFTDDSSIKDFLDLDSLEILELVVEVEQYFNITIDNYSNDLTLNQLTDKVVSALI